MLGAGLVGREWNFNIVFFTFSDIRLNEMTDIDMIRKTCLKGTVSVISSEPPCKHVDQCPIHDGTHESFVISSMN